MKNPPPAIEVEPRADGRWARQKQGTQRAASLHDRKSDAVAVARAQATRDGAESIVKNQQGRIERRVSHGRDSAHEGAGSSARGPAWWLEGVT